jgi:hypothetical protein
VRGIVSFAKLILMDKRAIKRLLVIVAVSIVIIVIFKTMMSKAIINLGKAAAEIPILFQYLNLLPSPAGGRRVGDEGG